MTPSDKIAAALARGQRFLLLTHQDPDADGVGSVLALGRSLCDAGKETTLLFQAPLGPPLCFLKGAERAVTQLDDRKIFDAAVILDCAEKNRLGRAADYLYKELPLINIDHHETNDHFGTLNLVDPKSSSTAELVFGVIRAADLPMGPEAAENLFAAIQGDTGSFRYGNTTAKTFRVAAELVDLGALPWDISRRIRDNHSMARLRLLGLALETVCLRLQGRVAVMTLTREMMEEAGAHETDTEEFVDYPRFIRGVEMGVLIRETGQNTTKVSIRSNNWVNAARLAARFGGGGHARAAGFTCRGAAGTALTLFLKEARRFLDGTRD
ncbi:MAG: bifunctional oligoribonuclease/PAP phosphatase NrnA [Deltaproteobacteria bacterium]|nr:bifunctional oligoribonuclease/PAP phosphatase NrnA [Deltaproteobacteria bacterium]